MGALSKAVAGAAAVVGAAAAAPIAVPGAVMVGVGLVGAAAGVAIDNREKKKHINDVKIAKECAYRDGTNNGKEMAADFIAKFANFYLATTALSYFAARCDGSISREEKLEIDYDLDAIRKNCDMPDGVKNKMVEISENENLTWKEVISYLDKVGIDTLEHLEQDVTEIIEASEGILPQEEKVKQDFDTYLENRRNGKNAFDDGIINAIVVGGSAFPYGESNNSSSSNDTANGFPTSKTVNGFSVR